MAYKILDNCINCDDCYNVCPVSAISLDMVIDPELCTSCGACGRVCPVEAVVDDKGRICEKMDPDEMPAPVINTELCTGCQLCIENCPVGGLTLSEPRHMNDYKLYTVLAAPEKCVGCGMCASVCPVHGITMKERTAR